MPLRKFLYTDSIHGQSTEQAYTDLAQFAKISLTGDAGIALDGGGMRAYNFGDPSNDTDLATKQYVDAVASGLKLKGACVVLADTNVTPLSGTTTIDSVGVVADDRVMLTNQGTGAQNGIWVVKATAWVRPDDYDTGDHAASSFSFIQEGTVYADTGWVCTTDPPSDIIDTDATAWTQFSGAGSIVAGSGLDKSGNTIFVGNGAGIQVNADSLEVELASNPGLKFDAVGVTGKLLVDVGTTRRGLDVDASGLFVSLATNPGLAIVSEDLSVLLKANEGLAKDASGMYILIDDTPDTLDVDSSGLKVVGLPLSFKINDVAVSASFTAANATSLVDGSTITIHKHKGVARVEEELTAEETVAAGDPVAWGSVADTFLKGDANNEPDSRIFGVAEDGISAPAAGTIVRSGVVENVFSGATPGDTYFLNAGGGLVTTPPTGVGKNVVQIGYAKNATDLEIIIQRLSIRS